MVHEPTCPSTTGDAPDARIIGFINPSGKVGTIAPPIALTDEMRASVGPQPERFFRLAGRCLGAGCTQWTGSACGLIGRMRQEIEGSPVATETSGPLPRCGIRADCVWWAQDGAQACRVCLYVAYNPSPTDALGTT
jgi:hypothetical protein